MFSLKANHIVPFRDVFFFLKGVVRVVRVITANQLPIMYYWGTLMSVLLNISCLKYKKTTVVTQILHNLMQRVFYILEFNHQCVSLTDMRFLMTCKVRSIYYIWTLTQFHNLCHQIINPTVQRMLLQNWSGFF